MKQIDLYQAVARATGETVTTVKRIGFLIADPDEPIDDPNSPELGGRVLDFDDLELSRSGPEDKQVDWSLIC